MNFVRLAALALPVALCALPHHQAVAQRVVHGRVSSSGVPVVDAAVAVEGTSLQARTDDAGLYRMAGVPEGRRWLVVRRPGYAPARVPVSVVGSDARADVELVEVSAALGAVVTTATLKETFVSDAPVKVEVLTSAFLRRNASSNLMDNLGFVNGLNQQVDCGVCFTNNIRINGMEGPYTAVLVDGTPMMSALATVYGLNALDPSLIEQVEIVKGPGSTLYGSEAMGGVINVVTKDPRFAPRLSVNAAATSHGETSLDIAAAPRVGALGGLVSVSAAHNDRFVDRNGDGFTDLPLVRRLSLFTKWAHGTAAERRWDLAARWYDEDRFGGVEAWTRADRGSDRAYGENIRTSRVELMGTYHFPGARDPLRLDVAASRHAQDSWYGVQPYVASQATGFAQLFWGPRVGDAHDLGLGVTLRAERYEDSTAFHRTDDRRLIPGIFAQDEVRLSDAWTVLGGLRVDHHRAHGVIPSPRLAVKWELDDRTTVRLNTATGFRVVNLFTEDHAALSGAREVHVEEALDPERSRTLTLSAQRLVEVRGVPDALSLDVDAYVTRFTNRILADFDTDPARILYRNLDGVAETRGVSVAAGYRTERQPFYANLGLTLQDVFVRESGARRPLPFAPRAQGVFTVGYDFRSAGVVVDWTGRVLGPMALPAAADLPDRSPWFTEQHLQLTKRLRPGLELYAAAKNVFGFVQPDAIIAPHDPFGPDFDPSRIYGPLQGRRMMVGGRYVVGR